jgi:hypothetical protein
MRHAQHAPTGASVAAGEAEREYALWIMGDTWLILIGCLDFYHFNNFNSIISLEINFFFYQNSLFFFSINRDLVHLISKLSEVLILFLVKWIPIITISTPKILFFQKN